MTYDPNTKYIITRHQLNMLLHDCAGYLGSAHGRCYKISQDLTDSDNPKRIEKVVSTLQDLNQRLDLFYETVKKQLLDDGTTAT